MSIFRRVTNVFFRSKVEREIQKELAAHIEMRIEDNISAGMSAREARRDALVRFGNPTVMRERTMAADVALLLESVGADVRFAVRQLARNRGFAVLALAICANAAIFAFVDAVLIRPMPYRDPARLVAVFESTSMGPHFHLSYLDYLDWKRQNKVFAGLEAYDNILDVLQTPDGPVQVDGATVSDGFFRALGVAPVMGRDFQPGEDAASAPRTVVLSYMAWQRRYGGRADVLGQAVTMGGHLFTVVGVLPKGFHFAPVEDAEFWTTLHLSSAEDRGSHGLSAIARLRDGVTIEAARAEMETIAGRLARLYPDSDGGRGATIAPLTEVIVGNFRPILLTLLGGAGLLLLIACVNVASLLLVRSEGRRRELALRGALGASRARLVQQFVTEGVLLVAISSGLGVAGASLAMRMLVGLIPGNMLKGMPYLDGLGLNGHVLGFACAFSACAVVVFSAVPLVRLRVGAFREGLAEGGRGVAGNLWRRLGANLVVVELATAMVLLVGAGLLGKSFYRLLHTETGMEAGHVAMLRVSAPGTKYGTDTLAVALTERIMTRVRQLPGVESVSVSHSLPVGNRGGNTTFKIVGRPEHGEQNEVNQRQVGAEYFRTLGARLVRGRYFRADEDATKPLVAIVNESMARRYFPGEDALDKRFRYDDSEPAIAIVGVVADVKEGPLDEATRPALYTPFAQGAERNFCVLVRSAGEPKAMLTELAGAMHEVDAGLLVYGEETMEDRIATSQAAYLHRASAWLVGGFAALALVLSIVGLYGVIAYSAAQRTREIGVRMALGAQRGAVCGMVMKEAAVLAAIGVGAGLVCSIGVAVWMRSLLFGTQAWDLPTLASVALVLVAASLLASYIPARRAASVNPVEALRAE